MMILYVSSQPNYLCVLTSGWICINTSQSVSPSTSSKTIYCQMICYKVLMILCLTIHSLINIDFTIIILVSMKMIRR
jgi:hypothetical protein